MRWLVRVAASTIVRRLTLILLAALLAWAGIGRAEAQTAYQCTANPSLCTRQEAWNECVARSAEHAAGYGNGSPVPQCLQSGSYYLAGTIYFGSRVQAPNPNGFRWMATQCPAGSTWDDTAKICANDVCKNAPTQVTTPGAKGLLRCQSAGTNPDGTPQACMFIAQTIAPGQPHAGYVGWVSLGGGGTCSIEDTQCPSGYNRGVGTFDSTTCYPVKTCEVGEVDPVTGECPGPDVCPAGQEKAPDGSCRFGPNDCPPGGVKGPDGSCIDDPNQCKAGTVKGSDGTCKPDEDGDGEEDEGDGHKATDAFGCGSPPVCSGDEIMCLHAKQLWRIDCNTRRNGNVTLDMYCNAPPVCDRVLLGEGNRATGCTKQEEAGLFLQWRQVCEAEKTNDALERIAENTKGGGSSCGAGTPDANCDGQPDWTANAADGLAQAGLADPGETATPGDAVGEGVTVGAEGLNTTGMGYGGTCPTIPDVQINGQTIHFDTSVFCNWLRLGGQFVLICATLLSLAVMTRGQG